MQKPTFYSCCKMYYSFELEFILESNPCVLETKPVAIDELIKTIIKTQGNNSSVVSVAVLLLGYFSDEL